MQSSNNLKKIVENTNRFCNLVMLFRICEPRIVGKMKSRILIDNISLQKQHINP